MHVFVETALADMAQVQAVHINVQEILPKHVELDGGMKYT